MTKVLCQLKKALFISIQYLQNSNLNNFIQPKMENNREVKVPEVYRLGS